MMSVLPLTVLGAATVTDGSGGVVGLYRDPPPAFDGVVELARTENVACRRGALPPPLTSSPTDVDEGCVTDRPSSTDVRKRT